MHSIKNQNAGGIHDLSKNGSMELELPAHVQARTSTGSSIHPGGGPLSLAHSTRNGIEPIGIEISKQKRPALY